jgi:hypothetical protein
MSNREPIETTNLATLYELETIPWERPLDLLSGGTFTRPETATFLGTVRPDGRPHAAGVGAAWHDGDLYFQCGPTTRKWHNLAATAACTISTRLEGIDLVFEGDATRVTDAPTLDAIAAIYNTGGWPVEVAGDTFTAPFSAPSAGPPPWHLFRLTIHTVFGIATAEPHGATRWRF